MGSVKAKSVAFRFSVATVFDRRVEMQLLMRAAAVAVRAAKILGHEKAESRIQVADEAIHILTEHLSVSNGIEQTERAIEDAVNAAIVDLRS